MTKEQLKLVQEALNARTTETSKLEEYKEVLSMFKAAGVTWASASKDTVKIVDSKIKAVAEDYALINRLRGWYIEEEL